MIEIQQQTRRAREAGQEADRWRKQVEEAEEEVRRSRLEIASLKTELEQLRQELRRNIEESKSSDEEVRDMRDQIQGYVTEIKRFEQLLELKERERRMLLTQYEELTKEVCIFRDFLKVSFIQEFYRS